MGVEQKAPKGQFRIVGVDTFDNTDWVQEDCDTLEQAQEIAEEEVNGEQMLKMHIYDDAGKHRGDYGEF